MKLYTTLLPLVAGIAIASALDCPECDRSLCKPIGHCIGGKTTDVCGCCDACYKIIGEECGGPWNVFGQCAKSFVCAKPLPPEDVKDHVTWYFNAKGICSPLV